MNEPRRTDFKQPRVGLTAKQQRIARRLTHDTHGEIANDMDISESTVSTHVYNIKNMLSDYPDAVELMCEDLVTMRREYEMRQIARMVEHYAKEIDGLDVTVSEQW